ncbi:MAG TPA: hypothetical protein VE130_02280 [Nitrososphaeraceae archaeon]|nr:hypothetical protein [Nitrososphaeraceae archaeon]
MVTLAYVVRGVLSSLSVLIMNTMNLREGKYNDAWIHIDLQKDLTLKLGQSIDTYQNARNMNQKK